MTAHSTAGRTEATSASDLKELQFLQDSVVHQQRDEQSGFWRSCSGCHETVDGYSSAPASGIFGCQLGNGCGECGGIGAVWDDTDYDAMVKFMQENEEGDAIAAAAPDMLKALDSAKAAMGRWISDGVGDDIPLAFGAVTAAIAAAKTGGAA